MMKNREIIYFITSNDNKFLEVSKLFKQKKLDYLLKQNKLKTFEIQATSLEDIAIFKLNSVRERIDTSFFVEDAGFFVDIPLKGFPGVYSSYVLKTIGNEGILKLIDNFEQTKAHFSSVIALFFKPLDEVIIFEGQVKGKVAQKVKGTAGFGFDPIFIPDAIPNKTFAEIPTEEKNKISHRAQAFKKLIDFIQKGKKF
jgi:XTP/dITP diphosphohydrolase